jgi:hypothetical protein
MSNFSTASRVLATIRAGDEIAYERGINRMRVQNFANGMPPMDKDLAKKVGLKINVNFGDLIIPLSQARRQYLTAFISNQHYFKVSLPLAPAESQSEWGAFITEQINTPIRDSLPYFELQRSKFSAVVCHGIGPQAWYHNDRWRPKYVAIEDLRVPTDTTLDFENLDWWAIRKYYTVFELINEVCSKKKNNCWAKKPIERILRNYKEVNFTDPTTAYDWETTPEKLAELIKQNGGIYNSDAMPMIPLYHFYFKDFNDEGEERIYMRVVPESGAIRGTPDAEEDFLWTSDTPVARCREELLHCQFGDLSTKAPFEFWAVRSLGWELLEPTWYTNLTRCRLLQHLNDNFNVWLTVSDPVDKARAQIQEFGNYNVLRTGVAVVPQANRHQIDHDLVEMTLANLNQLESRASSSYTQATDTGSKKEQTAFETSVKLQQVNALMSGLLMTAFKYETYAYKEICRRFCLEKTSDPDILKFQKRCFQMGIPRKWLDVDLWDIQPVTPLGSGNPTIAMSSAQQLVENIGMLDPTAQQEVKHEWVLAVTQDSRKAARWAPLGKDRGVTDGARDAQQMFGTLMQGVPVPIREGLPIGDQVDALLPLYAGKIDQLTKRDNMATPEEAQGLAEVNAYLTKLVQQLAQDPAQKAKVKEYMDSIGKLFNEVKGLAQRGQQHAQEQNGNGGLSPEQAKVHMITQTAAAKVSAKQKADDQKLRHKENAFVKGERRKDAEAFAAIQREGVKTAVTSRMKSVEE